MTQDTGPGTPFKMITATEARELISVSAKVLEFWLSTIDKRIREVSALGGNTLRTDFWPELSKSCDQFDQVHATPLQRRLIQELEKYPLQFSAKWEASAPEPSGGGFKDMDDTPMEDRPKYKMYAITIRW